MYDGGSLALPTFPRKNVRTDPALAQAAGFPTNFASGTMTEGFAIELLIDVFGEDEWFTRGSLSVFFRKPLFEGRTAQAHVAGLPASGSPSTDVRIWVDDDAGHKVMVGSAWLRGSSPRPPDDGEPIEHRDSLEALPDPRVKIGSFFGPVDVHITTEWNEQKLYASSDYHPRYIGSGDTPGLVHPTTLLQLNTQAGRLIHGTDFTNYQLAPGWVALHARDETEFMRRVWVGEKLSVGFTTTDFYVRKERPWWAREMVVRDARDEIVLRRVLHTALQKKGLGRY